MTDDIAVLMGDSAIVRASSLTYSDLGRPVGLQTGAALYLGTLKSVSFFPDSIYITVTRNGAEAKANVKPDHKIYLGGDF